MTLNEKQQDTERGLFETPEADQTTATPSEKFLLFRDFLYVCVILLHLGSAIVAIPTIVNRVFPPATYGCLAVAITTGVLVPLFGLVGYRDPIGAFKFVSTVWFELGWTTTIMLIDFIVAVVHASVKQSAKAMTALMFLETIAIMVYVMGLGAIVFMHRRKFPDMPMWKLSVQAVQWLRSSAPRDPVRPLTPTRVTVMDKEGNIQTIIPPWEHKFESEDDTQEVKIPEPTYITGLSSPDNTFVNAHPFWQERVQRQAIADDDMAYVVQRYGLNLQAEKLETKPNNARRGSHAKRPSIRELEISRPIPVASTIRRANTLATGQMGAPRHYQHQRGGSIDTYHRHSLQLYSPNAALDVPDDVVPNPFPSTRLIHPNPQTRALGLAARTLVGTSRPKATATRAYVDTSKPLPSPPAVIESDESLKSSDPSSLSHNFVMAMAQRVKISASSVKPLIVSTPKVAKSPSIYHDDDDEYLE
jgi:hypothetical protein